MDRIGHFLFPLLLICCSLWSFQKLDSKYQIKYGQPEAKTQIIEYFSFSCPKCLDLFKKSFSAIREKYIDTKKVYWAFHPDPADLLTLQAMVCLEKLKDDEKRQFFEAVFTHLDRKNFKQGCLLMQLTMEVLNRPIPDLDKMSFLEKTEALQDAFYFLKQKDAVTSIPTVEINGKIYDAYPSQEFLEKTLKTMNKG